jgi:hypothetical protein
MQQREPRAESIGDAAGVRQAGFREPRPIEADENVPHASRLRRVDSGVVLMRAD